MAAIVARGTLARAPSALVKLAPTESAPVPSNSTISAPAAKIRRPPHRTTAPGGSAVNSWATAKTCPSTAPERALALGRSRRITATPSLRRSNVTKVSVIRGTVPDVRARLSTRPEPVSGLVGVEFPRGHGFDGTGEFFPDRHFLNPSPAAGHHHPPQLVGHPLGPSRLEQAVVEEVGPVPGDLAPQFRHALAGRGNGVDHRGAPGAERGEVEHLFEVAPRFSSARAIGLVDDEEVGNLQEAGLVGLHGGTPPGVHHHDPGGG